MNLKTASIFAYLVAVAGVLFLLEKKYLISTNIVAASVQALAVILMIWGRVTFGFRSFHAAANTTKGKLVVNGPYRWLRHPIYASIIYFFWASFAAYPHIETLVAVLLINIGLVTRMLLEEKSLYATYPEYAEYAKKTKRVIPFLF